MIKALNISKKFVSVEALNNVSIEVNDGEVACIIGPSGSGKSTLCRCLCGLEEIDEGKIIYNDREIDFNNKEDAKYVYDQTGFVFQHFHLFPHLTVEENMTLSPIHTMGMSKEDAVEKAKKLLGEVDLLDKINEYPSKLSGGQKQRVAIARALMRDPKIMLFDEPTSALDPEMIKEVLLVMKRLAKKGMTMIIVTHEINFAKEVADKIVFIDNGEVVEEKATKDFFTNASSKRVKDFLDALDY